MSKPIAIVSEQDTIVGTASKQQAWKDGLPHRVVRIMLENDAGEVLVQKRAADKDIFPNCWDNSAAGHVDAGEDYEQAAVRELAEEIGETGIALEEIGRYRSDETYGDKRFNRFTRVYKGHLSHTPRKLEAGKVAAVEWWSKEHLLEFVMNHRDKVTDGLRQVVERYYQN